jgi:hypothetical protein
MQVLLYGDDGFPALFRSCLEGPPSGQAEKRVPLRGDAWVIYLQKTYRLILHTHEVASESSSAQELRFQLVYTGVFAVTSSSVLYSSCPSSRHCTKYGGGRSTSRTVASRLEAVKN